MEMNMETNVDNTSNTSSSFERSGGFDRGADRNDRRFRDSDRSDARTFSERGEKSESVRDSIIDAAREHGHKFEDLDVEKPDRGSRGAKGREQRNAGNTLRDDLQQATDAERADREAGTEAADQYSQGQGQSTGSQAGPPPAWAANARATWDKLPEETKQAVLKREQDVIQGFNQFRQQYANFYGEIDQAIAPYAQEIQRFGKTPGQAVAQLFSWFDVLAKDPDRAFPALLKSYRYDPRRLAAAYGYTLNGRNLTPNQQQAVNRQQFQNYINSQVQQAMQPWQQQQQQQQAAWRAYAEKQQTDRTNEMLQLWARDKPHFEVVRYTMGQMLSVDPETGESLIPLKNGKVDLDGAYEAACRFHKVHERAQAQRAAVNRARRAGSSLSPASPGGNFRARSDRAKPKGMSVRESLNQAIDEMRNG
jgi:hypothetical protein